MLKTNSLIHYSFYNLFPDYFCKSSFNIIQNSELVKTLKEFLLTGKFPTTNCLPNTYSFLSIVPKSHLFHKIFLDLSCLWNLNVVNFMSFIHSSIFSGGIFLLGASWGSLKSGYIFYQLIEQPCSNHLISLSWKCLIYKTMMVVIIISMGCCPK